MKVLACVLVLSGVMMAQTSTGGSAGGTSGGPGSSQAASSTASAVTGRGGAAMAEAFSEAVANDLLLQVAEGMESRNPQRMLRAFDPARFAGYARFSDQVGAWFREQESFRVYYKLRRTSVEEGRGVAVVDFEYEAKPIAEGQQPVRRRQAMRFIFERGAQGWKIVDVSPRSFFS